MNLGRGIRVTRKLVGMTQKDIEARSIDLAGTHISQSYISLLEKGKKRGSFKMADLIAKTLKVPVGVIILNSIERVSGLGSGSTTQEKRLEKEFSEYRDKLKEYYLDRGKD